MKQIRKFLMVSSKNSFDCLKVLPPICSTSTFDKTILSLAKTFKIVDVIYDVDFWKRFFKNITDYTQTCSKVGSLSLAVPIPSQGRRSRWGWGEGITPPSLQICLTLFQSGEGLIMPTTILLVLKNFQTFLRPCKWSKHQKLIRNFTN